MRRERRHPRDSVAAPEGAEPVYRPCRGRLLAAGEVGEAKEAEEEASEEEQGSGSRPWLRGVGRKGPSSIDIPRPLLASDV